MLFIIAYDRPFPSKPMLFLLMVAFYFNYDNPGWIFYAIFADPDEFIYVDELNHFMEWFAFE